MPLESEILILMRSGLGVRVRESHGMLDVMVVLPPSYNTSCRVYFRQQLRVQETLQVGQNPTSQNVENYSRRCYTTMGLLGTYNKDPTDDLTTLTGTVARATGDNSNAAATQMIYESFGQHCKVKGGQHRSHSI